MHISGARVGQLETKALKRLMRDIHIRKVFVELAEGIGINSRMRYPYLKQHL